MKPAKTSVCHVCSHVQYVTDVPGGMPVRLEGLGSPLVLRLVVEEEVLRTRVRFHVILPFPLQLGVEGL